MNVMSTQDCCQRKRDKAREAERECVGNHRIQIIIIFVLSERQLKFQEIRDRVRNTNIQFQFNTTSPNISTENSYSKDLQHSDQNTSNRMQHRYGVTRTI